MKLREHGRVSLAQIEGRMLYLHLAGDLVCPDVLLDVNVSRVREPAGVEVDGVGHSWTGDVNVAPRVRVRRPVCHGDVFGVVGKD
jgi:hypothetical protein